MKKSILGIFLIIIISFNIQTSFGYNVTYEEWGVKIKNNPSVCIFEPDIVDDKYLTDDFVKKLMKATTIAIDEWRVLLENSERTRDKSMWKINQIIIPFENQKTFNFDECNTFIHFRDKPELQEDFFKLLGKTSYELGDSGRSEITVYYAGIEMCKTEDVKFIYYDPCYSDSPRLIQQLSSVVKHEFGHTLGLGHFVSDDQQVNIDWARGVINAPSIMAVFTHQNHNENRITPIDIDKVRSMYGEIGFLQNRTAETKAFESFESEFPEYVIPDGGFQIAGITGLINKEKFISGIQVVLEITDPDGKTVLTNIRVNSDGGFNIQKIIDASIANGTYFATASYRGEKSDQISFDIVNEGITKNESKIPQWVKNSVRWWSEDKIENVDFVLGIRYLIKIGVLNPLPDQDQRTAADNNIIDSDGDDIQNKWDSCINEPETFNGILDNDGCPETDDNSMGVVIDTDHDGIPDTSDQCPKQKEEYNKIQDSDGCPETDASELSPDSDFDGIADKEDVCPYQAEVYNRFLDNDGCPDKISVDKNNIVIPEWIKQNAKWWVNGEISDEGFIAGIQYLVKTGIIRV
jgi:hypothetical protein